MYQTRKRHDSKTPFENASSRWRAWYPLQTRYQCEKKVDAGLRDMGFESFAPMRLETRRWSDRIKVVELPVFPGYMFVRMEADPKSLVKVLRLPGLVRFVTSGRELVPVPNAEIDTVRALTQSDVSYEPGPFPVIGERVRIHGGCLQGIEGVLTDQTDRGEVVIAVGAIQRSLRVLVGDYRIERLSETSRSAVESCADALSTI
jgi:transcription antitermination factor NusG